MYKFDYENSSGINNIRAQDHWGYYNGENNNSLVYNDDNTPNISSANRMPKLNGKHGILKSITYPTGGIVRFKWEQNTYGYIKTLATAESLWGGFRIASIEYSCSESEPIVREFKYTEYNTENSLSSGTISETPYYRSSTYNIVNSMVHNNAPWSDCPQTHGFHSNGLYSTPNGGSHIEYPIVWEIYPTDTFAVRYEYSSQREYPDLCETVNYAFIPGGSKMLTSQDYMRGNLKKKEFYKNGILYKEESYGYHIAECYSNTYFCGDFFRILNVEGLNMGYNGSSDIMSSFYATCPYQLIPYNKGISHKYLTEYYGDLVFTDSVSYTYLTNDYSESLMANSIKSIAKFNSKGQIEKTYYSYYYVPNEGFVDLPETEVTVCEGVIISGKMMVYDEKNRLKKTFRCPPGIHVQSSFGFNKVTYQTAEDLKSIMTIPEYSYKYDEDGNITEISYEGVPIASYIWSYQGTHPIAEIKGVSYDDVCNMLPGELQPAKISNRYDVTESELSAIRSCFPNNEVTTIVYSWHVGVTTLTNSRGIATRYNYDEFGRLEGIKDYNNFFIKKYEYNYR